MIVVSNSSPLITFGRIGHFSLLNSLFGRIHIASEVFAEVVTAGIERPAAEAVRTSPWVVTHPPVEEDALTNWQQRYGLGKGELGTIFLARTLPADLAIIDERLARKLAKRFGLQVIGCVGLLEIGYQHGLLSDLRLACQAMLGYGIFIDKKILNSSLAKLQLPVL